MSNFEELFPELMSNGHENNRNRLLEMNEKFGQKCKYYCEEAWTMIQYCLGIMIFAEQFRDEKIDLDNFPFNEFFLRVYMDRTKYDYTRDGIKNYVLKKENCRQH